MSNAYRTVADFLRESRKAGGVLAQDWKTFHASIASLGFPVATSQAIDLWTLENLERHRPELVRWRVLHDVESRFISTAAQP